MFYQQAFSVQASEEVLYKETGTVIDRPRRTTPQRITEEMKTAIDEVLKINNELTARQLQLILKKNGPMLLCPAQLLDAQEKKLDGYTSPLLPTHSRGR